MLRDGESASSEAPGGLNAIRAERDENAFREPLTTAEMVEIGKRLEALEKPKAKERAKERKGGRPPKETAGNLPAVSKGDTRDKVAAALGVSGKTYEKAKKVAALDAAESDPVQVDGKLTDSRPRGLCPVKAEPARPHAIATGNDRGGRRRFG